MGTPRRQRGLRCRDELSGGSERREPGSGRFLRHTRLFDHRAGGADLSCVPRSGGTHKTFAVLRQQGRRASARSLDPRSPPSFVFALPPLNGRTPWMAGSPAVGPSTCRRDKLNLVTRISNMHTRRTHRTQGLLEGESEGPMGGACRAPKRVPGGWWWRHGRSASLFGQRPCFSH